VCMYVCMCTHVYMSNKQYTHERCFIQSCNMLQHISLHCNTMQHAATHYSTLQHTATHNNTPRPLCHQAKKCKTLQNTAIVCNAPRHTRRHTAPHSATNCNPLHRTATRCNTTRSLFHQSQECNTHFQIFKCKAFAQ